MVKKMRVKSLDEISHKFYPCLKDKPKFEIGDQIELIEENLQGTIRWIGAEYEQSYSKQLIDHVNKWIYGLQLSKPIGDSDGHFEGRQRFKVEPNHAKFVEEICCIKKPSESNASHFKHINNDINSNNNSRPSYSDATKKSANGYSRNQTLHQNTVFVGTSMHSEQSSDLLVNSKPNIRKTRSANRYFEPWNAQEMLDCDKVKPREPPFDIEKYFREKHKNLKDCYIPEIKLKNGANLIGKNKGIQGDTNSCYLDATLFSMFAFCNAFDKLLLKPKAPDDIAKFELVQAQLRLIVYTLRNNYIVENLDIKILRQLLADITEDYSFIEMEKEPQEFMEALFCKTLKIPPFLKYNNQNGDYFCQLITENLNETCFTNVQQLFDHSFNENKIKFASTPSILILQLPRSGKKDKQFKYIKPTLNLDITRVLQNAPQRCDVCSKLAEFETKLLLSKPGEPTKYEFGCKSCIKKLNKYNSIKLSYTTKDYQNLCNLCKLEDHTRTFLELFAVLCIETSHYVSFNRCGSGDKSQWSFFDSMAERYELNGGYNVSQVNLINLKEILAMKDNEIFQKLEFKQIDYNSRRLFQFPYLCFYRHVNYSLIH